jgi:hypothetical protein
VIPPKRQSHYAATAIAGSAKKEDFHNRTSSLTTQAITTLPASVAAMASNAAWVMAMRIIAAVSPISPRAAQRRSDPKERCPCSDGGHPRIDPAAGLFLDFGAGRCFMRCWHSGAWN